MSFGSDTSGDGLQVVIPRQLVSTLKPLITSSCSPARAFPPRAEFRLFPTRSSVGTSTLVYPAAELPFVALNAGATVIEVNPNPTSLTEAAHFSLRGSSGRVLPEIVQTGVARRGYCAVAVQQNCGAPQTIDTAASHC